MILHLHFYPPHRDTRLELPNTGLIVVHGLNGSGKSSLVEAYAACIWGRSLRGASPWRSEECFISVSQNGYTVERTPTDVLLNGAAALKPSKKQPDINAVFGDFGTWQRTRVFDADLTARFGASGDSERKKLLEQLLGLEKLDNGLKRCREDIREADKLLNAAERNLAVSAASLAEQPEATDFDEEALDRCSVLLREVEQRAAEMAKKEGEHLTAQRNAERQAELFRDGHCPTCEQAISATKRQALHHKAAEARTERVQAEAKRREAVMEGARLLSEVKRLQAAQAQAERAAQLEARRAELLGKRDAAQVEQAKHAQTLCRLRAVEDFIAGARPSLLRDSLAILEAAASAWLPGLTIGEDMIVRHGSRTYKELNEGHRRLCDMAVLLGLSSMGDAKVKGPLWLDGCAHGLDEDRQDAVAVLLETVAQRELVIVLTCVEETAQRLRGQRIRVVDGRCEF